MITAYVRHGHGIVLQDIDPDTPLSLRQLVWLDVDSPTAAEAARVAEEMGIEVPSRDEIREIESSSRLYTDKDIIYLTLPVVVDSEHKPILRDLALILTAHTLVTVRYASPKSIATCAQRIQKAPALAKTRVDMLAAMLDSILDRLADTLETIGGRMNQLADRIFEDTSERPGRKRLRHNRSQTENLHYLLHSLGASGELVNKVRSSLAGMDRLLAFSNTFLWENATREEKALMKTLSRDLRSLVEHASFLNNESSFLLDATLGLISMQQNTVITIFSVVAVVFLPPTLIASMYGMNFRHMPELDWPWGYPIAIAAMLLSAVLPTLYFRWKNWL